jgi:hypothetical protein
MVGYGFAVGAGFNPALTMPALIAENFFGPHGLIEQIGFMF